jgi:hypothetical protein
VRPLLTAALVAAGLTLAGCSHAPSCPEQLAEDEAVVRTTHHLDRQDLPGVGDYVEVHWQADAAGDPCARAPGPTDWHYQDVIVMREADAAALKAAWDWLPVSAATPTPGYGIPASPSSGHQVNATPSDIWPTLAEYLPKSAHWMYSGAYDEAGTSSQWRDVYFDPDHAVLLVFSFDH